MVNEINLVQPEKAELPIEVIAFGRMSEVRLLQEPNSLSLIMVKLVKYCSSSNEVIFVLFLNTCPRLVTPAASARLSSPSPL